MYLVFCLLRDHGLVCVYTIDRFYERAVVQGTYPNTWSPMRQQAFNRFGVSQNYGKKRARSIDLMQPLAAY